MLRSMFKPLKSVLRRASGANELSGRIDDLEALLDLYRGDLLAALSGQPHLFQGPALTLESDHLIAADSDDHRFPRGTKNDNTRYPRFCAKCEAIFRRPLKFLDIGCSGGGLVFDFLLRGHLAVGLEGSDYSFRNQRAEWRVIPNHLFTCDVTKPFNIRSQPSGATLKFDVISAWEVLEHIPEASFPQFFRNVVGHMADDGFFVASVATFEDWDPATGAVWHVTVKPREWWLEKIETAGLVPVSGIFDTLDFPRLPGGVFTLNMDGNTRIDPKRGFHLTLKKAEP